MVQRQSTLFLPTLREDPADAEAVSHKLLVRAGLIRQVGAGLWTFLPAGWRVHEKIVQIIREEMNAIGGQEMFMPVLAPAVHPAPAQRRLPARMPPLRVHGHHSVTAGRDQQRVVVVREPGQLAAVEHRPAGR